MPAGALSVSTARLPDAAADQVPNTPPPPRSSRPMSPTPDWPRGGGTKQGFSAGTAEHLSRLVVEDHLGTGGNGLAMLHNRACDRGVAVDHAAVSRGYASMALERTEVLDRMARKFEAHGLRDDWFFSTAALLDRIEAASAPPSYAAIVGARPEEAATVDALVAALVVLKQTEAEAVLDNDVRDIVLGLAPLEFVQERKVKKDFWRRIVEREFQACMLLDHRVAAPTALELARWLAVDVAGTTMPLGRWCVSTADGQTAELDIQVNGSACITLPGCKAATSGELERVEEEWGYALRLTYGSESSLIRVHGDELELELVGGQLAGKGRRPEGAVVVAEAWAGMAGGVLPVEVPSSNEALPPAVPEPRFALLAYYLVELGLVHCRVDCLYSCREAPTLLAVAALRLALRAFGEAPRPCDVCLEAWAKELLGASCGEKLEQMERSLLALWASPPLQSTVARKWRTRTTLGGALPEAPTAPVAQDSLLVESLLAEDRLSQSPKEEPRTPSATFAAKPDAASAQKEAVRLLTSFLPSFKRAAPSSEAPGAAPGDAPAKRKQEFEDPSAEEPCKRAATLGEDQDPADASQRSLAEESQPAASRDPPRPRGRKLNAFGVCRARAPGAPAGGQAPEDAASATPAASSAEGPLTPAAATLALNSVVSRPRGGLQADMAETQWWDGVWFLHYKVRGIPTTSRIEIQGGCFTWQRRPYSLQLASRPISLKHQSGSTQIMLAEKCSQDQVVWYLQSQGEIRWTREVLGASATAAAAAAFAPALKRTKRTRQGGAPADPGARRIIPGPAGAASAGKLKRQAPGTPGETGRPTRRRQLADGEDLTPLTGCRGEEVPILPLQLPRPVC